MGRGNRRWVASNAPATKGWRRTGKVKRVTKAVKAYVKKRIDSAPEHKQWASALTVVGTPISISNTTGAGSTFYFNYCGGVQSALTDAAPYKVGPGAFQRIGARIKITSISYAITMYGLTAATTNALTTNVRVLVVRDKLAEGTNVNLNDFIYDVGADLAVYSPYKLTGLDEYQILSDRVIKLNVLPGNTAAAQWNILEDPVRRYTHKFNPPILCTYYTSNTAGNIMTATSIEKNSLALILVADGGSAFLDYGYINCTYTDA